jgi:hypothetical protein
MQGDVDGDGSNIGDGASDGGGDEDDEDDDGVFARSTVHYHSVIQHFFIHLYTRFESCF